MKKIIFGVVIVLFMFGTVMCAGADGLSNVALTGVATQSSTATFGSVTGHASNAIDGNITTEWDYGSDVNNSITHTNCESGAWWQVGLDQVYLIKKLVLWNRTDHNLQGRINNFDIIIIDTSRNETVWSSRGNPTFSKSLEIDLSNLNVHGDLVKVQLQGSNYLHLAEVQVLTGEIQEPPLGNVALTGMATQSSTATFGSVTGHASNAIDGNITTEWDYGSDVNNSITHTNCESGAWWQVGLDQVYLIKKLVLWNRTDHNLQGRINNFDIIIIDTSRNETVWSSRGNPTFSKSLEIDLSNLNVHGDLVKVQLQGRNYLHLAEVQVYAGD